MTALSVETHALALTRRWRAGPAVAVVPSTQDLPFEAPSEVKGAYLNGNAFVVADAHLRRAVMATVAHEAIGHHGVRQLLGAEAWDSFMRAIHAGADAGDERLRATRDFVRWVYVDSDGTAALARAYEADEVCAAIAEAVLDARTGTMRPRRPLLSLWRAARGHIEREVLLLDSRGSYDEVEGILRLAELRLRRPGLFWQQARRCYHAAMTVKFPGPKVPARSLAESERLLKQSRNAEGEWHGTLFVLSILILVSGVGFLAWEFFRGIARFLN